MWCICQTGRDVSHTQASIIITPWYSTHPALCAEPQAKLAATTIISARPLSLRNQACRSNTQFLGSPSQFNPLVSTLVRRKLSGTFDSRKSRRVAAASSSPSEASSEGGRQSRTKAKQDLASLREKVTSYIEKRSGYFWLGGPAVGTAAVVIPPVLFSVVELLQKNFFMGLLATFALDAIFVLAADLFFVVADKAGHQQAVPGGPPPWIGPWEYTGYPKGEPTLTKVVSYAGVAIGALGLVVSLFLGKLAVGLPALGSYLALIFIQVRVYLRLHMLMISYYFPACHVRSHEGLMWPLFLFENPCLSYTYKGL